MVKSSIKKFALTLACVGLVFTLTACQTSQQNGSNEKQGVRFIEALPAGVTTAFVSEGKVWIVMSNKAKLEKVGDGIKKLKFTSQGGYQVFENTGDRYFLRYADGTVDVLIIDQPVAKK